MTSSSPAPPHGEVVGLFLDGARVVAGAIGDRRVAESWGAPSVLEEQTVGSVAAHLARGGVWVVSEYLHGERAAPPVDFESAAEYYASFVESAGPEMHRAVRERGAALAAAGHAQVVATLHEQLGIVTAELEELPGDHLMTVIGGKVMRLGDYLVGRIVEQAVHLDDLARSIGAEPWILPERHLALAISVGVEVAEMRRGETAVLRALYRRGFAEQILPVL